MTLLISPFELMGMPWHLLFARQFVAMTQNLEHLMIGSYERDAIRPHVLGHFKAAAAETVGQFDLALPAPPTRSV
jgi:hypothetical protein